MPKDTWWEWPDYVSVGSRKRGAERHAAKLTKGKATLSPVVLRGKTIANTFWGKSWCANLEQYSDFANRLPRGRSYLRNGLVLHLEITPGKVVAKVSGSYVYDVSVAIAPVAMKHWKSICADCAGAIDSLVELLRGQFSKSVMERLCRQGAGLFPAPKEIELSCSCPDGAYMCKHVAAVLYGVGARLDEQPALLFRLRNVDESALIAEADGGMQRARSGAPAKNILVGADLSAMFGVQFADTSPRKGKGRQKVAKAGSEKPGRKTGVTPSKRSNARKT